MAGSSWTTPTSTTALFSAPSCRTPSGSHSLASSKHGSATTLVASFSTSSPASSGASTFTFGSATSISPKIPFRHVEPCSCKYLLL
uniref:Uncharacterized protein n=1 Tax=Lotus japonicus TaxID=34305 RepID=I3SAZ7_LOTJA|nr:unknown [Lotus japonicus]